VAEAVEPAHVASFGDLLRQHRRTAHLTQEELAERAGVSARTIGDIERGISNAPHRDTVRLLQDALGLTGDARTAFDQAARRPALHVSANTALAAGSAPPLVGRAPELDRIERYLHTDGAPLLLVAAEPGMGKTRLLAEAARRSAIRGWCVLEGGCQRRSGQEPFAPLVGALAAFLAQRPAAALRSDLRGCAWLVRLLPELADAIGETLPSWTMPRDQERRLMFQAVERLLDNVAARDAPETGVLLVLDDLQWAGSDAIELLTALVRPAGAGGPRTHRARRVVGAYRNNEVQPADALGLALADWAQARLVEHHTLPPLSPAQCGELIDALVSAEASTTYTDAGYTARRQRLLQRAGGVPFFVVSYAHALREGGAAAQSVPWDVAQGIRQRVAVLPEAARALLSAAAVVGRELRLSVLAAVTARSEDEVIAGLEVACQARLLIDTDLVYRFAHDLVREVVEADISSARRASMHRRAAAAIETLHAGNLVDACESLADHWLRGEAWEQALEYLVLSGDKAARAGAIGEALKHYHEALAICARLGASARARAVDIANKRGFVCYDAGEFAAAAADFARMREDAAQLGDRRREGLALAQLGMANYYNHEFEAAEQALRDALSTGQAFDDVRLFATVQLNSLYMIVGRHAEAAPLFRAAEQLAVVVDDPLSRSWWGICGSEVLHWSGRYAEALAHLARSQDSVEASNQLVTLLWTKWETALASGGAGAYAQALAMLDDVIATCRATGETFIQARALNTAGWIHGELNDHVHAVDLNGQSVALAAEIETADTEITSNARLNLGDSLAALGRLAEADEHYSAVERVVRNPRPQDRWMLWRYAQHLFHSLGELSLARGDVAGAIAYADECLNAAEASESLKNIVKARRLRGQALFAQRQLATAEAELGQALEGARRLGNPPQLWKTLVAVGDLRGAASRPADAGVAYREAVGIIEGVAGRLLDLRMRQVLLSSPPVQRLMQQADAAAP
jgi:tetratricopeptide (TPR) repeat protein/transcriptional regulator with XRE-family HTH domain